ncbi:hypothetical protein NQZ68_009899 [Dissostichus eleginoides]|nr:hypothetical protein NQZ68_009899 [Dissostichus eleginoides]
MADFKGHKETGQVTLMMEPRLPGPSACGQSEGQGRLRGDGAYMFHLLLGGLQTMLCPFVSHATSRRPSAATWLVLADRSLTAA